MSTIHTPLDMNLADSGAERSQEAWTAWHNKNGTVMASAADVYYVSKQLRHDAEHGTPGQKEAAQALTASLREDFEKSWLVTSTIITYAPPSLLGTITHHYGATKAGLEKQLPAIEIPVYDGVGIATLLRDKPCEHYLQQLFDTQNDINIIILVLEYMSGKPRTDIMLWTPPLQNTQSLGRHEYKERAVRFYRGAVRFRVDGDNFVGNGVGRSRGVR